MDGQRNERSGIALGVGVLTGLTVAALGVAGLAAWDEIAEHREAFGTQAAPTATHRNVHLLDSESPTVNAMGGMFFPMPWPTTLTEMQANYLPWVSGPNGIPGMFTTGETVQGLYTPEWVAWPTMQWGAFDLLNTVKEQPAGSTFTGDSQSAGIIGLFFQGLQAGAVTGQPASFNDIPMGDHFVAWAPPTMPDAGQLTLAIDPSGFGAWSSGLTPTQSAFPTSATDPALASDLSARDATVDVYCSEYDQWCNSAPSYQLVSENTEHGTNGWEDWNDNSWAEQNAFDAGLAVHVLYPTDGPLLYNEAVQIVGGDYGAADSPIKFFMLPDPGSAANTTTTVLPMFQNWEWLAGETAVTRWSEEYRPAIDAVYLTHALADKNPEIAAAMAVTEAETGAMNGTGLTNGFGVHIVNSSGTVIDYVDGHWSSGAPDLAAIAGEFTAPGYDGVTTINPGDFISGSDLFNPADIALP